MDRTQWLAGRRINAEQRFDRDYAPTYDADDVPLTPTHVRFLDTVVAACPAGGAVLDAACGTGRAFQRVLDAGRRVLGTDQSAGMLAVAAASFPRVELHHVGLQELAFDGRFGGAVCIDAMENVPPEDWPPVLAGLRRAVSSVGLVYLSVEEVSEAVLDAALDAGRAAGLPMVHGETLRGGGYHFYPAAAQVGAWLKSAGLAIIDEARTTEETYGYHHLLAAPV